jgi:hypothetical protein
VPRHAFVFLRRGAAEDDIAAVHRLSEVKDAPALPEHAADHRMAE